MTFSSFRHVQTSIASGSHHIAMELIFPRRPLHSGVIFCQGLRSYNRGFLSNFAMATARAGYLGVKFDYVGTGRSNGLFEEKLTSTMLNNLEDVIDHVAGIPNVKHIGVVARSNSGSLLIIHGRDHRITTSALISVPVYYNLPFENFKREGKHLGRYYYHKSFKRKHTKGEGRLPDRFFTELETYAPTVLKNVLHIPNVIHFQGMDDEVLRNDRHFEYLQDHLPQPHKSVRVPNANHSFLPGKQNVVIRETISWFKNFLS